MSSSDNLDVYLHGMSLLSRIHLLQGRYPDADSYGEIRETWVVPGGESANAAILLARFGLRVRLDGPHLGSRTEGPLREYFAKVGVDASGMALDKSYGGLEDLVLVGGKTRTVFGTFERYFSKAPRRWSRPDREALRAAKVVSLDPYFREDSLRAAQWCLEDKKPMVTIDCPPDSPLHQAASFLVLSREFLGQEFPGGDPDVLLKRYTASTDAWVIFTAGSDEIRYARRGGPVWRLTPYRVDVKGTLGAGDSFRAAVVFGVHQGWDAERTVRFAAATAAVVCTRFPVAADPPDLRDIERFLAEGKG